MTLSGRRAVVTGATRGIGAAIAQTLDEHDVRTFLIARNKAALAVMTKKLNHAVTCAIDLTDPASAGTIARQVEKQMGGTDILINNAGAFTVAPVEETTDAIFAEMLALNLAAPLRLIRAFLPAMRAKSAGHIVTIGSVADRAIFAGNSAYAATKYGARAMHEVIRQELRGSGIRTSLVSPGPTDTPLWDAHNPDNTAGMTPRAQMLRAEQVAEAVLWVLTRPPVVNVDELRLSHS
jgi:NADP-dependent 3-hydroxy acid dehydrogenase YdfG